LIIQARGPSEIMGGGCGGGGGGGCVCVVLYNYVALSEEP